MLDQIMKQEDMNNLKIKIKKIITSKQIMKQDKMQIMSK